MAGKKSKHKKHKQENKKIGIILGVIFTIILIIMSIAEARGYDLQWELKKLLGLADECTENLEVHFIDVGQGDCILIRTPEKNMLIDSGETDKGDVVLGYLKSKNIKKLDYVIGTHTHSDHLGCMSEIIDEVKTDEIIMPYLPDEDFPTTRYFEKLLIALEENDVDITEAETGMKLNLGEAEVLLLAPQEKNSNTNNYSVGAVLTHGRNSFVFTGDAEKSAEKHFIESGLLEKCTVYKAGHHGSNTSSSEEFMAKLRPDYAVIMCGEGNSYNHPEDEAVARIAKYADKKNIYRTDLSGTVVVISDGEGIGIKTEK